MFETRMERGFVWPKEDRDCARAVFATPGDMEPALEHCKGFDVVVQAGGNCGVWPLWLSERFKAVYTFEPDPLNFYCLSRNCAKPNIIKMQAALGDKTGFIDLARERRNIGAHYIDGEGLIPTLCIDSLGLEACDYICLDIEGYELKALHGAKNTIEKYSPVIQVEDKGLSDKYGSFKGDIENWLISEYDYEVIARPHRDVILAKV